MALSTALSTPALYWSWSVFLGACYYSKFNLRYTHEWIIWGLLGWTGFVCHGIKKGFFRRFNLWLVLLWCLRVSIKNLNYIIDIKPKLSSRPKVEVYLLLFELAVIEAIIVEVVVMVMFMVMLMVSPMTWISQLFALAILKAVIDELGM